MLDLSKQQLILVALLVSFVTSLATGIVTVSLLDQAPAGVTRTVSQVIEKTIQQAMPQNAAVGSATTTFVDATANAVDTVSDSIVKIQSADGKQIGGLGLLVSKYGIILTDKSVIAGLADYSISMPDGSLLPLRVTLSQINGGIVFLAPVATLPTGAKLTPIRFAGAPKLGQTVFSLFGTSSPELGQGIITSLAASSTLSTIQPSAVSAQIITTISVSKVIPGSPLFDLTGAVIGMYVPSGDTADGAGFYPISQLQNIIPSTR